MVEGEQGLRRCQFEAILEVDNIGGLEVGQWVLGLVFALADFVVQFGALQGK